MHIPSFFVTVRGSIIRKGGKSVNVCIPFTTSGNMWHYITDYDDTFTVGNSLLSLPTSPLKIADGMEKARWDPDSKS